MASAVAQGQGWGGWGAVEPYPDVVLPVVSLLEFLRRVGKSLQNKWERRNEPRGSRRSQALPTPAQEHSATPTPSIPAWGFLQHPGTPLLHGQGGSRRHGGQHPGRVLQGQGASLSCLLLPSWQAHISRGIAATRTPQG